jgi:GR25 family glycosyltransferase involved in LPS biosynthesis
MTVLEGYYINLDHRTDRLQHFEALKTTYPILSNIKRMSAIYNAKGAIGCALSHVKCLQQLANSTNKFVAVFEDDFYLLHEKNFKQFVRQFEKIKNASWDVLTLTPRGQVAPTEESLEFKGFQRIVDNQTMTGYIIKTSFIPVLLGVLKEGIKNLLGGGAADSNACDQAWKILQADHVFIYYKEIFGGQLPGWSSIEGREVNYNARFIQQGNF